MEVRNHNKSKKGGSIIAKQKKLLLKNKKSDSKWKLPNEQSSSKSYYKHQIVNARSLLNISVIQLYKHE